MNYWSTPIEEFFLEDQQIIAESIGILQNKVPLEHRSVSHSIYNEQSLFFKWVHFCAKQYLSENFNENRECYIDRAWAVVQRFGVNNDAHSHAPFDLAAVYYVNANEQHPELEIFDPRPPHFFNNVFRTVSDGAVMGGCRSIKIKAENNKLVIFPGYLLHGVGTNMSQEPRACISMNINVVK